MNKSIVIANSGGLDSAIRCKQFRDLGYQVHSLYIDFGRLGRDEEMAAAQKTADEFCVSHHTIKVDLGYSPAHYEDADHFVMQDDIGDEPLARYYAGPPNMPMIVMALTVSYAKKLEVLECTGGYGAHLSKELIDIYNSAQNANLSLRVRPQFVTPDETRFTEDTLTLLGYKREEFPWVFDSHTIPEAK